MGKATEATFIRQLADLTNSDVDIVGGKNASLGEMIQRLGGRGVRIPKGFATTADTYWNYLEHNDLGDRIAEQIGKLDGRGKTLEKVGESIRKMIRRGEFSDETAEAIRQGYRDLCEEYGEEDVAVAVRSSATAEDLPEASFAGQQETFLNITGEDDLLNACKKCFASLFTDRAIAYREEKGFDHLKIALSVGVQKMVRADTWGSGVMFSIDTETGFPHTVVIDAAWGLGENVVQGTVVPDEYRVFKPLLEDEKLAPIVNKELGAKENKMVYAKGGSATTKNVDTTKRERRTYVLDDDEILQLARWACVIEAHYDKPMDMEWAKDGETGDIFILQARPETVQSQKAAGQLKSYRLKEKGEPIVTGLAIGQSIAGGEALVIASPDEMDHFKDGAVLVTEMTDPDWVPIMKRASAIVTDKGGRTSHAAIVSRELGVTAIVGSGDATEVIEDGQVVTVSCAEGDEGYVYDGELEFEEEEVDLSKLQGAPVQLMMNIASPSAAYRWWRLPVQGIGLARMEFIVNNAIKIHPLALLHMNKTSNDARKQIAHLTRGYEDKTEYFVETLARGIGSIAAAQHPNDVIVRMSDFKSNEYADLIGGDAFEPKEENPMLGYRGASRYYEEPYREAFALECQAIKRAREHIGLDNIIIMIPFCRTPEEADKVEDVLRENGLERGKDGLQVYMMCEIPSNVLLGDEFCKKFDGVSIGTNDLTQLVLGVDRDSQALSELFDERNEAVKRAIKMIIDAAHDNGIKIGICGQAPSGYPDFAKFLVDAGIDTISLAPDSVVRVVKHLTKAQAATLPR